MFILILVILLIALGAALSEDGNGPGGSAGANLP